MPNVNFTFSTSTANNPIFQPDNIGTMTSENQTSSKGLYLVHDSTSTLENVGFFIQPFSGTGYVGLYGESVDYLDVLEWGTQAGKGLLINQDSTSTGTSYETKFVGGTSSVGDNYANAIELDKNVFAWHTSTSGLTNGEFPANHTAHFTLQLSVPSTALPGTKMLGMFLKWEE